MTFALVCLCGGFGAMARFVVTVSIQRWWTHRFPLPTFIINSVATFCAGVAAAAYAYQTVDHFVYLLFVTGFLGGFSTFSTAINEMVTLARKKELAMSFIYCVATIIVPIVCVSLGWTLIAVTQ